MKPPLILTMDSRLTPLFLAREPHVFLAFIARGADEQWEMQRRGAGVATLKSERRMARSLATWGWIVMDDMEANGGEEVTRLLDFDANETSAVAAGGDAGFDLLHGAVVAEDLLAHARAAPASRGERVAPLDGMG